MYKNTFFVVKKKKTKKHPVIGEGQLKSGVPDVSACLNKLQYIALQCSAVSGYIILCF